MFVKDRLIGAVRKMGHGKQQMHTRVASHHTSAYNKKREVNRLLSTSTQVYRRFCISDKYFFFNKNILLYLVFRNFVPSNFNYDDSSARNNFSTK